MNAKISVYSFLTVGLLLFAGMPQAAQAQVAHVTIANAERTVGIGDLVRLTASIQTRATGEHSVSYQWDQTSVSPDRVSAPPGSNLSAVFCPLQTGTAAYAHIPETSDRSAGPFTFDTGGLVDNMFTATAGGGAGLRELATRSITFTAPPPGAASTIYHFRLRASITLSGSGTADTVCSYARITVRDDAPPVIEVIPTRTLAGDADLSIDIFNAVTDTDPATTIAVYQIGGPRVDFNLDIQTRRVAPREHILTGSMFTMTAPHYTTAATLTFAILAVDTNSNRAQRTFTVEVSASTDAAAVDPAAGMRRAYTAPVANAGEDQTVAAEGTDVFLDGGDSTGDQLRYTWTQTGGHPQPFFAAPRTTSRPRLGFQPQLLTAGDLTLSLTVTDIIGTTSAPDTVTVSVTAADNDPPAAPPVAGTPVPFSTDIRANPGNRVNLQVSAYDPEGQTLTYAWTAPDGITLSDATTAQPSFTAPALGAGSTDVTLEFTATVTDAGGASGTFMRRVIVTPTATLPIATMTPLSQRFTVVAGADQTVDGGATVTLSAAGSAFPSPYLNAEQVANGEGFVWTQASGTSVTLTTACLAAGTCVTGNVFSNFDTARATFTAPAASLGEQVMVFVVSRTVDGVTRSDSVRITVEGSSSPSQRVTASIAGDMSWTQAESTNPATTTTWTASHTTIPTNLAGTVSYQWTQIAGETLVVTGGLTSSTLIISPQSQVPSTFTATFQVVVTVGSVVSTPATRSITVNNANTVTVDAGADQTVAEGDRVQLVGTVEPGATSLWTQYGGPTVILNAAHNATTSFNAPQVDSPVDFFFALTVTDSDGLVGVDTTVVRVTGENARPVATATARWCGLTAQCTQPTAAAITVDESDGIVHLAATVVDDGSYTLAWTQTAGPDITIPNAAGQRVNAFPSTSNAISFGAPAADANYELTFSVIATDARGLASEPSTVTVSVTADNDPPVLALPAQRVDPGASVDLSIGATAFDEAGQTLTYEWQQVVYTPLTSPSDASCIRIPPRRATYSNGVVYLVSPGTVPAADCTREFVDIPAGHADSVTLSGAATFAATFTAPLDMPQRDLYFRLTVTDSATPPLSNVGIRRVQVRAVPSANAGDDASAYEGMTVQLDGSDSDAGTYRWRQTAGPTVTLDDATITRPAITLPDLDAQTVFTFDLTVTDAAGRSNTDTVNVTGLISLTVDIATGFVFSCEFLQQGRAVPAQSGTGSCVTGYRSVQTPLTADPTVTEGASVGFTAAGADARNNAITYTWAHDSGAAIVNPTTLSGGTFAFTAPTPITAAATTTIRVTATAGGITATDTITVTVNPDTTTARPTVTATIDDPADTDPATGGPITVAEGATINLDGSGTASSASGDLSYMWTQTPATPRLLRTLPGANAATAATTVTAPPQLVEDTTFTFSLVVLEQRTVNGAATFIGSVADTVSVTVTAGENDPPVADVGVVGSVITVNEGETVTLAGGGTDPEGETLTYRWTRNSGMSRGDFPVTLSDATIADPTFTVPNLIANDLVVFSLVVTDGRGLASAPRSLQIRIVADNDPPIVDAGPDQAVEEGVTVILDSTATDPEGERLTYVWTQILGPSVTLIGGSTAAPSFVPNLAADATLQFRLVVTDSGGIASAPDLVNVVVTAENEAPTANAGGDRTVTVGTTVRMTASASSDPEGALSEYRWQQVAGEGVPLGYQILGADIEFTAPSTPQILRFMLSVVDAGGLSDSTYVNVTVSAGGNDASLSGLLVLSNGHPLALDTTFRTDTYSYSVTASATAAIDVRADTTDSDATVALGGTAADGTGLTASGDTVSGLTPGANSIVIRVTSADNSVIVGYGLTVMVPADDDADNSLAAMRVQFGINDAIAALTPAFAPTTTAYTATVPGNVSAVAVHHLTTQTYKSVLLTGMNAEDEVLPLSCRTTLDDFSVADCLTVGENTLNFEVLDFGGAAGDGRTYTIMVTRAPPDTDASLSALSLTYAHPTSGDATTVAISPAFAPATTAYAGVVENSAVTLSLATTQETARFDLTGVDANGSPLAITGSIVTGAISGDFTIAGLSIGASTVTVTVTAQDETTTSTYSVALTRIGPATPDPDGPTGPDPLADATLRSLSLSLADDVGRLDQTFSPGRTTYTVSIPETENSVTVTLAFAPTNSGARATATLNGNAVSGQTFTADVSTADAVITILVTSANGQVTRTYTITITKDNPVLRAKRMELQVVMLGNAVSNMAADMVRGRIGAEINERLTLSIGGKRVSVASEEQRAAASGGWAANPFEREKMLADSFSVNGGAAMSGDELLRSTTFQLSPSELGFNVWGAGSEVGIDGDADGTRYDGEFGAYRIGTDVRWREDGLLGVALAQISGTMNVDDAANNDNRRLDSRLKTSMLGLYPYATLRWSQRSYVWLTAGFASGNAEITETTARTTRNADVDMEVLSGALGLEYLAHETFKLRLDASFNRSTLDSGTFDSGIAFGETTTSSLRVNAGVEAGYVQEFDNSSLRPFLTLAMRRDIGDGDEGNAVDFGAGVEWQGADIHVRLEGSGHLQGDGSDEERLGLSARRSGAALSPYASLNADGGEGGLAWRRGRLSLDVKFGMSDGALSLQNLLGGEVRF